MQKKFFTKLAQFVLNQYRLLIIISVILTFICAGLASTLKMKMSFKELMPQSHPTVKEYNKIIDNYSAASNIIIGAIGTENELKQFADEIAPQIKTLKKYIKRVNYKINRKFFEKHGFMLTKTKNLKNSKDMYRDLGLLPFLTEINNNFESTYVADGEKSISNKEKENKAVVFLDAIKNWLLTMQHYAETHNSDPGQNLSKNAVDKILIGNEYFLSQDKDMILLFAQPTFPIDEMEKSMYLIPLLDKMIGKTAEKYPSITYSGTAGAMALAVQETIALSNDMSFTSLLSFVLIILIFIVSFRMWAAPLLAGISLICGIAWTSGLVVITLGQLNMMTSMFAVILIGLGIDFNIHVISVYNERRAEGKSISESVSYSFLKAGKGILIGSITTAMAFLTMMISENAGMKEFGFVAGSGVLFCMIAAMFTLPSLLILRDKRIEKKTMASNAMQNSKQVIEIKTTKFDFMGNMAEIFSKNSVLTLTIGVAASVFLIYSAFKIEFNYDYINLQPENINCITLQDSIIEKYDMTPDMVMTTTNGIEESRTITEDVKDLRKTGFVTSISQYIPSEREQKKRQPYIKIIKNYLDNGKNSELKPADFDALINEIYRIEDNIIELAQLSFAGGQDKVDRKAKEIIGDLEKPASKRKSLITKLISVLEKDKTKSLNGLKLFNKNYEPLMRSKAKNMTNQEKLSLAKLPSDIKERFTSEDGKHFLVSIYPKEQAWDFDFLRLFSEQMHRIDERVTGMPLVFYILIKYIGEDGTKAAILTMFVIFFLLLYDYKNIKLTLLTITPLIIGTFWMIGFMYLFGMKLNILNLMGVPLILGIGIDNGVHIIHRYKIEGKNKICTIFSSTGKAVLLSSITTFLAFGALGFASSRGLASMGLTLAIGITTCFLATVIILPAIIGLTDNNQIEKKQYKGVQSESF